MSRLIASRTGVIFGSRPSATARTAMSRSVIIPTKRPFSRTGMAPMSNRFIFTAACISVASAGMSSIFDVIMSRSFMVDLPLSSMRAFNTARRGGLRLLREPLIEPVLNVAHDALFPHVVEQVVIVTLVEPQRLVHRTGMLVEVLAALIAGRLVVGPVDDQDRNAVLRHVCL